MRLVQSAAIWCSYPMDRLCGKHKEKCNSWSSCEVAEIKATDECAKYVLWLQNVLSDLSLLGTNPTPIFNDNMAAVNWSNSTSHKAM
jgi:hypothetical protein